MMPKRLVKSVSVREERRCVLRPHVEYPASVFLSVERKRAQDLVIHVAHWKGEKRPVSGSNLWIVPPLALTARRKGSLICRVSGLTTRLKVIPLDSAYAAWIFSCRELEIFTPLF